MKDGNIMQIASPIELFNNPENKFVAGFIGSPQMNFIDGKIESTKDKFSFVGKDGISFDLSGLKLNNLKKSVGKEVCLGVRSENLRPTSEKLKNYAELNTKVSAIELLGSQKHIYTDFKDEELVATFTSEIDVVANSTIPLFLNLDMAYFFESDTGQRIYWNSHINEK